MKRFRVFVAYPFVGVSDDEMFVELPDNATDAEVEEACQECLDSMLECLDSGWHEETEEETKVRKRRVKR